MSIKCKRLSSEAKLANRKHPKDAGMDVFTVEDTTILANSFKVVKTGVTFEFPDDTVALVWPKSRAPFLVGAGVVDSNYQGEIMVKVFNTSPNDMVIPKHEGVAQIVIVPVLTPSIVEVDEIHEEASDRGDTGGIAGNS